ncbi:alkaline phosphatase family protein [Rugosimonospora africana]|uniref:phospholipase C n=1 Tax=Rugosimonospora africana TaxID=556532 RepID=A0A8J3QQD5_9ACTN|nr:alkaline phosphatase family protein [Rugosimonospora africana]GIH14372.1 putative non-hemolytic phospholipase C [Rugosimonospora africana]
MSDTSATSGDSAGVTRRRLLGSAAAAGGATAASLALPVNVRKALASPPKKRGSLKDIEHVVMLMQENRSFDHYFGTLSGVRGFSDPHAIRLPNGRPVYYQPDPANPDGYLLPYRLNTRISAAQAIPSTSHEWAVQHAAWNGGKMDNWVPAHMAADGDNGPYIMGYLTREDIPFQYALADAFTICDAYHCSVLGPTGPNRHMWMAGTIDPNGVAGGPSLTTSAPNGQYSFKTYPERLSEAGVSWKIYHQPGGTTGLASIQHIAQYFNAQPGTPLYDQGMATTPIGQFEYDALNDKLPTVSWLLPPSNMDEHPANLPAAGASFVASKVDAIAANPDVWAKTVFILSYDENDGLFDHVLPPTPKPGTPDEFVFKTSVTGVDGGGLPTGLGFRVPCVIVSPWTVGGWVATELFDHTSQLRFLERITGVMETNITDWRRRTVGDLTSAFRFNDATPQAPALPDTTGQYNLAQYEVAKLPLPTVPTTEQSMPRQEPGHRKQVK